MALVQTCGLLICRPPGLLVPVPVCVPKVAAEQEAQEPRAGGVGDTGDSAVLRRAGGGSPNTRHVGPNRYQRVISDLQLSFHVRSLLTHSAQTLSQASATFIVFVIPKSL